MPMDHRYHLLDVFTREAFGGNALAVFADARTVPPPLMPHIARELNLSETVFVLPPAGAAASHRLRIFTPGAELPFAGHPTVGTACLLALLGRVPLEGGESEVVLEEGVGDVRVRVRPGSADEPPFAQLSAARMPEIREAELSVEALATLLSLEPDAVVAEAGRGAVAASCGVPFLFVPLRDRDAVRRARLDLPQWETRLAHGWAPHVYVYAFDAEGADAPLRARMFAPAMGIAEDPATGGAATALAGLLALRAGTDGTHRWRVEQGYEMGRPSQLELEAVVRDSAVVAARVGGHAVLVGEGVLRV